MDGNTKTQSINLYDGIFGYIYFPFHFKCILCINSLYEGYLEKVKLEDISFNKQISVYCNDQIEARYILTPLLMKKLLILKKKMDNFKLTIFENKLYLSFPNKNIFELKYAKSPAEIESIFDNLYNEISIIISIINKIKNNNKVFKI